jgi:uncharacterized protein with ParB-like and HNH nuclease domain/predicted transport protein
MIANQAPFLELLDGKKQYTIPIYQRTYSWKLKQCVQLLQDIIRVGSDEKEKSHFVGSVVYFNPATSPVTSVPELLVIDGQQRLTTISLLLLAIINFLKKHELSTLDDESWEEVLETYLVNKHRKDHTRFKLLLTRKDKETYTNLVNDMDIPEIHSAKVFENYKYFFGQLNSDNIQAVYLGIKKLIIVDVILERDKDNPQLIFESLNSTGVDLTQADLIRNYILMGQPMDVQEDLYMKYWYPMEQSFGEKIDWLAWFIRDYLTMKLSSIPKIGSVYEEYKAFLHSENGFENVTNAVKDLFKYAKFYVRLNLKKETDSTIANLFKQIRKLKIDTSYPFLLAVYGDYEEEQITKEEFVQIIQMVANYVFRRAVCGIPTNSLNKTFATFYKKVKRETYLESIQAAFLSMDGYRRFPNDDEFKRELQIKDVYSFRSRNYLLESLENWKRKELVNAENYTIEHILPQNPNTPEYWQTELGNDWEKIKEKYLHTIGNLSLTGYNSELSDKSFSDKKKIEGGFDSSPLFLNESVRVESIWNETAIHTRASKLTDRASIVWLRPDVEQSRLELYKEPQSSKELAVYDIAHFEHLQGDMMNLYRALEKRVLNLDTSVRVEFKKLYVAFKVQTNFLDIVPQKKRLRLSLNVDFNSISDPKGLCKDVSGLGRWGNGDVEVGLQDFSEIDDVMKLIVQAFEEQIESV